MDWSQYSDRELLGLYASLMEALCTRGIVRSSNNPIADFSESLVARTLGLVLDGRSTAGYDATDPTSGLRYQIKGRRLTKHNPSTQLSALRGLDQAPFDILAAVMFDADFNILYGALITPGRGARAEPASRSYQFPSVSVS